MNVYKKKKQEIETTFKCELLRILFFMDTAILHSLFLCFWDIETFSSGPSLFRCIVKLPGKDSVLVTFYQL